MTIKDIAKAANVSAATVSRIINHKDENISQETRERVLRIIAENDYIPYAKIRDRILAQTQSIGLVVPTLNAEFYVQFASQIQQLAQENNYSMVLALNSGASDAEASILTNFSRNRTDGIIIFPGANQTLDALKDLYSQGTGVVVLDHYARPAAIPQIFRSSSEIARECTQYLLDHNSVQIGLVMRADCPQELQEAIISGYSAALADASRPVQQNFIMLQDETFLENFRSMADAGLDGVVCQDADVARTVYAAAGNDDLRIPEDISVISMEDSADSESRIPALTAASTDVVQMARVAFDCLLSQIQGSPLQFTSQKVDCAIISRSSVRSRRNAKPKILVAGYINTDILLGTPDLPQIGKTQVASHIADYVGGKGANQAYGIGKLGGNVYLLGRLGSDRRGRFIYEHLLQAGVKMDGVSYHATLPTGSAYISLYPDGRSSVLIDPGANVTLDTAYIRQNEALLRDADYCLVQTDIPMESVTELQQLCVKHSVPLILNCSYGVRLPEYLLKNLHTLIIKDQERQKLYPQFQSQQACAEWLRSVGVENVIFTSGISGYFWAGSAGSRHFPNYGYPIIDETGTSDVFTGCFVTLLAEGTPLEDAISAAAWAAAFSATKLGVQSGFPNRDLLLDVASGNVQIQFQK